MKRLSAALAMLVFSAGCAHQTALVEKDRKAAADEKAAAVQAPEKKAPEPALAVVDGKAAADEKPAAEHPLDKKALADHVRETINLPAHVNIEFGEPRPSEIPGFDLIDMKLSVEERSQSEAVYISKDGRYYSLGKFNDVTVLPSQERIKKMDLKNSPFRGKSDAPVTVVQYTDFQCPFCQKGYELMRDRILKDFPGKVRWVYKSMPLGFHDWAESAAVAAECAKSQSQEKFWAVHDKLFDKQKEIRAENAQAKFFEAAKAAGVDEKSFRDCYSRKETAKTVQRDSEEALSMGINGTPAFIINGRRVDGADPQALHNAVADALKRAEKGS
ncbi:MAG: thioredoxin domain-containing protein [Elusimicrobiota bacterium]|jgi:protein-disulfide isomerase